MGEPAEEESASDSYDGADEDISEVVPAYKDSADCHQGCPTEYDPSICLDDVFVTEASAACCACGFAWFHREFQSEPCATCNAE